MTSLYNAWRPQTFADIIGQQHVARTLSNALVRPDKLAHAYLLAGPRGTGKTTTARVLAKAVNCQQGMQPEPCNQCANCVAINRGAQLDLMIEIDGASHTGVDDIRDLREKVSRRPAEGRRKVYIIDEVHMLSTSAFNALLKTLEEPPPHVIFVLATTDPHKIPATVLSRCQRFDLKPIATTDLVRHLRTISEREQLEVDDAALEFIARSSTGSVRDALSLLDQAASFAGQMISESHLQDLLGLSNQALVLALVDALIDGDLPAALATIQTVSDSGADLRQFGRQIVEFLRVLLLGSSGINAPAGVSMSQEALETVLTRTHRVELPVLVKWLQLLTKADQGLRTAAVQPQLPLELAVVQSIVTVGDTGKGTTPLAGSTAELPPQGQAANDPMPSSTGFDDPDSVQSNQLQPSSERASPDRTKPQHERASTIVDPTAPSTTVSSQTTDFSVPLDGDSLSLASVEKGWPAVLRLLGRRRTITALLRDARVVGMDANEVVLEFDHRFHAEQIERPENRLVTEQALQRVFNNSLAVRVVVKGASNRSQDTKDSKDSDPVVRHALAVFEGATIIREKLISHEPSKENESVTAPRRD